MRRAFLAQWNRGASPLADPWRNAIAREHKPRHVAKRCEGLVPDRMPSDILELFARYRIAVNIIAVAEKEAGRLAATQKTGRLVMTHRNGKLAPRLVEQNGGI